MLCECLARVAVGGYCLGPMAEWFLFLPQVRMGIDDVVLRAQTAERNGFDGIAFIDHLEPPGRRIKASGRQ